jgi:hypothetical protein
LTSQGAAGPSRRRDASSPWSSEEGREFLQERIARFSGFVAFMSIVFFVGFWIIGLLWDPASLDHGWPVRPMQLFHLGGLTILLTMWLIASGRPLPITVLRLVDSLGIFLVAAVMVARGFSLPIAMRPDLLTLLPLFALLLYRAAVVPSEPSRTARIGAIAVAPLPAMTWMIYSQAPARPGIPPPVAFTVSALLFSVLVVILSTTISRIIYGLRQTVREARRMGPYTLVEKIGEGGMGAVYRARHALLRRPTAIKILPPERAGEMDLARFEREVQMTSLLTSPYTVSIYDFGRTPDGLFYYAMEFLEGIDLQELVSRDGPMPSGRVVPLLRQVCEALGEAHRVGLIHRDVKPANILLCERAGRPDVAKVVDFGLVKDLAAAAGPGVTNENIVLGTPHYLSPEALRTPDRIDARSDIYALGATAYYLLTGTPVFEGTLAEIFAQHLGTTPAAPSERLGRPVPPALEALVLAALAKDPAARPETAEAFEAALAACEDGSWTAASASQWWRTRGARILAARAGAPPPDETMKSLEIDRTAPEAAPPSP